MAVILIGSHRPFHNGIAVKGSHNLQLRAFRRDGVALRLHCQPGIRITDAQLPGILGIVVINRLHGRKQVFLQLVCRITDTAELGDNQGCYAAYMRASHGSSLQPGVIVAHVRTQNAMRAP